MADRPNILLVFTDQHRLSAVGAYGPTPCRTPNIDRLAAEGTRFENAYTSCPVCSPARATVMTGLYPHAHGVTSNVHNLGCSVNELPDVPILLPRRLEQAGYDRGYSGKWHLGTDARRCFIQPLAPSLPTTVGFEGQDFPGHGGGGFKYPQYRRYLADGGWEHQVLPWDEPTRPVLEAGVLGGPTESTVPYFLASHTISLIDRFGQRGRPWFIWHNFWGPHGPYYVTREYREMYRDVEIPPWPNYRWDADAPATPHKAKLHPDRRNLSWDDWAGVIRYYYGFATMIDAQIGRIIEHLRQTGELENTVVIFTADHGETLGSHGGMTDKGWHHWEETHRIPWIMRFGRQVNSGAAVTGGRVIDGLVSLTDLYPTILDLAGGEWEESAVHGRSLMPLIDGSAGTWRDEVFTEFGGVNWVAMTQRTIRWDRYKYGWNVFADDELYDLTADPHEKVNLIDDPAHAGALAEGRRRMAGWMGDTGDGARGIFLRITAAPS